MKARFLALAALLFGMAACQTEPAFDVNMGDGTTTISVVLPEDAITRASDTDSAWGGLDNTTGETVRVIFEVYYKDETNADLRQVKYLTDGELQTNFDVRLVPGRDYTFVAWADMVNGVDAGDKYYNTENLKEVKLLNWAAMDEARDAFTATKLVKDFQSTSTIELKLVRPFAKLRIVTTDMAQLNDLRIDPTTATITYVSKHYNAFNAFAGQVIAESQNRDIKHENFDIKAYGDNVADESKVLFTDYFFAAEDDVVKFTLNVYDQDGKEIGATKDFTTDIPVKRNNLTTIKGNVLTEANKIEVTVDEEFGGKTDYDVDEETITETVDTAEEFKAAFESGANTIVLDGDINLDDLLLTRAAYTAYSVQNGKTLAIDLNGHKLSATTSENSGNQELFLVKGTLTVKNGTIEYKHVGENMGWGSMTTIFDVTAGGVLNLEGVTAKNLGGSDMGFVAHLNNWGEVTLNVENCDLESNYVPVRVFNSGNDMNNVTIKNSTLKGVSAAFWVHNYTAADFGSEAKAEAQKALLNLNIYDQGNTFSPDINGIRYGFTNSVRTDAYGITKVVSEDGTEVTLGSILENGLIRRGVAGAEENSTIKKVVIEEGVGVLYDRTFRRFYALEEVVLPSTLTTIGAAGSGVFQSCTSLKSIVIPESVTVLGKGSFQECSSLESINIPSGVTRIEENALRATGLVSVEFHAGVTYFGAQAFRDCKQLKEVYIYAPEFTIEANAFGVMAGALPGTTIYVANAEMKAYLESTLAYKNQFTIVAPAEDKTELKAELLEAIKNGETNIVIDAMGSNIGDLNYGLTTTMVPEGTTVTIRNAAIEGTSYGNGVNGTIIFEGCTFNNSGAYSIHFDNGNGNVIFKNCHLYGWNSFGSSLTSVSFDNCTLTGNGKYALIRSYVKLTLTNCTIDVSDADHNDKYSEGVEAVNGAELTWENTVYEISSKAGMYWFANEVNVNKNSFSGKTVKLAANIDLENQAWTPVGQTGATTFNGVFDGQNYTISNLNINSEAQTGAHYSSGLFGWVESHTAGHGHIKNVKINGATIVGHHNCGALVGYITQETALVENCHVTGATVSCTKANNDADGDKAGALIGNATVATPVKDCTAANSTVSAGRDAGQVIGAGKAVNVTGCSATDVTVSANGTGTGANVRSEVIGRLL